MMLRNYKSFKSILLLFSCFFVSTGVAANSDLKEIAKTSSTQISETLNKIEFPEDIKKLSQGNYEEFWRKYELGYSLYSKNVELGNGISIGLGENPATTIPNAGTYNHPNTVYFAFKNNSVNIGNQISAIVDTFEDEAIATERSNLESVQRDISTLQIQGAPDAWGDSLLDNFYAEIRHFGDSFIFVLRIKDQVSLRVFLKAQDSQSMLYLNNTQSLESNSSNKLKAYELLLKTDFSQWINLLKLATESLQLLQSLSEFNYFQKGDTFTNVQFYDSDIGASCYIEPSILISDFAFEAISDEGIMKQGYRYFKPLNGDTLRTELKDKELDRLLIEDIILTFWRKRGCEEIKKHEYEKLLHELNVLFHKAGHHIFLRPNGFARTTILTPEEIIGRWQVTTYKGHYIADRTEKIYWEFDSTTRGNETIGSNGPFPLNINMTNSDGEEPTFYLNGDKFLILETNSNNEREITDISIYIPELNDSIYRIKKVG